ncbi:cytochrome P450 [Candidatus Mycobacterium wuenschmannii]|uniref:Cytochrome P450 n=1 Tax=Candidatus Mycobacterium wuenschmannii TaxID=3027808 RepID=A0ABY8W0N4_9MYCO|nr:cytochrome P450 [Candidatus Mycobacterium wuenschmannii]WIM88916.1 cytochrome P450 [Candidatus Mycobacterium wuenschmannii]
MAAGAPIELFDDDALQDPYPLYARMRAGGAVRRIGKSDFYAVSSWDAVVDAVARVGDFSSNLTATMQYQPDGTVAPYNMAPFGDPSQVLAIADDPVHAMHRKLLVPHLSVRKVRALEAFAAETAARLWVDGLRGGRIEWMGALANRLPMLVVARLIGVPESDVDKLVAWGYAGTQMLEGLLSADQLAAAGVSVGELAVYIAEQFARASASPRDDLLGGLTKACAAGELDDIAALAMMITLFAAGGESTASLLGSATWIMATRPDIQRQVRDDPALLETFIEETLRFEPPFRGHYRHVTRDTTLAGTDLPAGSRLILLWGAANRDPAHYESPDEFRLDRASPKAHIAFGKGAHFCVGAALARIEARIVLSQLLARTTHIAAVDAGRWLPSLLVRRLEHLELAIRTG